MLQGDQQVFGADVFVFELVGFFERVLQDSIESRTDVDFRLPLNLGQLGDSVRQVARQRLQIDAELLQDRQNDAFLLLDQGEQKMLGRDLRIAVFLRMRLRRLKGLLALQRQLVKTNHKITPRYGFASALPVLSWEARSSVRRLCNRRESSLHPRSPGSRMPG